MLSSSSVSSNHVVKFVCFFKSCCQVRLFLQIMLLSSSVSSNQVVKFTATVCSNVKAARSIKQLCMFWVDTSRNRALLHVLLSFVDVVRFLQLVWVRLKDIRVLMSFETLYRWIVFCLMFKEVRDIVRLLQLVWTRLKVYEFWCHLKHYIVGLFSALWVG